MSRLSVDRPLRAAVAKLTLRTNAMQRERAHAIFSQTGARCLLRMRSFSPCAVPRRSASRASDCAAHCVEVHLSSNLDNANLVVRGLTSVGCKVTVGVGCAPVVLFVHILSVAMKPTPLNDRVPSKRIAEVIKTASTAKQKPPEAIEPEDATPGSDRKHDGADNIILGED